MPVKIKKYPDKDILNQMFDYKNGQLLWKNWNNQNKRIGNIAGSCSHNYRYWRVSLTFNGKNSHYYLHRLIWIWHYGNIPTGYEVDHIDLNKSNNKIENLRLITHYENKKKQKFPVNNTSGMQGVYWYPNYNKWLVKIMEKNKPIHIGYYENKADAIKARKAAEIQYGYHKDHGKVINEKLSS